MTRREFRTGQGARPTKRAASGAGRAEVVWTVEKVRALGLTTDVATAASILGFGRTLAFDLLRTDDFPVPVLRVGRKLRVPVPGLLARLGADQSPTERPHQAPANRKAGVRRRAGSAGLAGSGGSGAAGRWR
ncbi:hypothetical protein [Kineosporia sp. NBRC 101731]|uniref:hypothetical protein n=1 Tax=Kineosporia sp. NBRC 101731 TaxID=3032199 RepID=UPI0024A58562|nr:hypothetical protein [Kineosporia sp. NBRC 101731]GLY33414.1 hypothetical protein Kisp02_67790 [Kineosporia sp. NBRC 101731]